MKLLSIFVLFLLFYIATANDTPGFFLKTTKNIPRLGKRVFIKQGSKNIPRLGRRSDPHETTKDAKNYSHVQPYDSKFIFDFLLDDSFFGDGELKFISWATLDKALESDTGLKQKLASIARDKEVEELRKYAYEKNLMDDNSFGDLSKSNKVYQKFIPYDSQKNYQYNNEENDVYYYYASDDKRADKHTKIDNFSKIFANN